MGGEDKLIKLKFLLTRLMRGAADTYKVRLFYPDFYSRASCEARLSFDGTGLFE